MVSQKNVSEIATLVFKAVGLAMAVAVAVEVEVPYMLLHVH